MSFDPNEEMLIAKSDLNIILGCIDTLGVCLADHNHTWTEGENEIYEQSIEILKQKLS